MEKYPASDDPRSFEFEPGTMPYQRSAFELQRSQAVEAMLRQSLSARAVEAATDTPEHRTDSPVVASKLGHLAVGIGEGADDFATTLMFAIGARENTNRVPVTIPSVVLDRAFDTQPLAA